MNRHNKNAVSGYVNFPVDKMPSSGEGGMFVRLVVLPDDDENNEFMECSGGYNHIIYDESYVGSDEDYDTIKYFNEIDFDELDDEKLVEMIKQEDAFHRNKTQKHFPNMYDEETNHINFKDIQNFFSIPYLAIMTIGSSGWSNSEWICTYDDLTDEGKELYNMIKNLYGDKGKIVLQTWLDT